MPGISLIAPIRRAFRESARRKRVSIAATWPQTTAEINSWKILPAGDEAESFTQTNYIEAGFHFILNGEFYGGYLRSVAMSHREAEKFAVGSPRISVRYNPEIPDQVVVLAEDNPTLQFTVISG